MRMMIMVVCILLMTSVPVSQMSAMTISEAAPEPTRSGSTLTVGAGGTYDTIQEAVDNATDGDTVHIYAGTYYEYIHVNKSIEIKGNDSIKTIIDGSQNEEQYTLMIDGSNGDVENITVTGIGFKAGSDDGVAYSILADGVYGIEISSCEFERNGDFSSDDDIGGILMIDSSNVTVKNCNFVASSKGVCIRMMNTSSVKISYSYIKAFYTGIEFHNVSDSITWENHITTGNGMSLKHLCQNNTILKNSFIKFGNLSFPWDSFGGKGIGFANDCDYNRIEGNHISGYPKGITIDDGSDENIILNNTVLGAFMGLIFNDFHSFNKDWDPCRNNEVLEYNSHYNKFGLVINNTNGLMVNNSDIRHGSTAISGEESHSFSIHNSTIMNWTSGYLMSDSSWGSIKSNLFYKCQGIAMTIYWSIEPVTHTRVIGNAFVLNSNSGAVYNSSNKQVITGTGVFNTFDNGSRGNYWSDWTSPDLNSDGIVDNPYHVGYIDTENVYDRYPLAEYPLDFRLGPEITMSSLPDGYRNTTYSCVIEVVDPDNHRDDLDWSLDTNATWLSLSDNGILSGIPALTEYGNYWVAIFVDDGNETYMVNLSLRIRFTNTAPVITTANILTATEDTLYSVDYDASDDEELTWSLITDSDWLSIDSATGVLSGTPKNGDVGTHSVKVSVSDGVYLDFTEFMITVSNTNDPPMVILDPGSSGTLYVNEDEEFSFQFSAKDEDPTNDTLTWSVASGSFYSISGMTDPATGISDSHLNGTAGNDDVGTHVVVLTVSDGKGGSQQTRFNLTVNNTNDPPVIKTNDITTATENIHYSVNYSATDIDPTNDTITWSLSTNCTFLSISYLTGLLNGTPVRKDAGTFWVNVTASDGNSGMDSTNFTLVVITVNAAPMILVLPGELSLNENSDGMKIDLKEFFKDPDNDDLTFTCESVNGVDVKIDGNGVASIIPDPDWVGEETITIHATDGTYSVQGSFIVIVNNVNDPPSSAIIHMPSIDMVEGNSLYLQATSDDPDLIYGDVMNYSWYLDGILIGYGEEIQFDMEAGEFTLILRVTDSEGEVMQDSIDFTVEEKDVAPSANDDPPGYLVPIIGIVIVILLILILVFVFRRRTEKAGPVDGYVSWEDDGFVISPPDMEEAGMAPGGEISSPVVSGDIDIADRDLSPALGSDSISFDFDEGGDLIDSLYEEALTMTSAKMSIDEVLLSLEERYEEGEITQDLFYELSDILMEEE